MTEIPRNYLNPEQQKKNSHQQCFKRFKKVTELIIQSFENFILIG